MNKLYHIKVTIEFIAYKNADDSEEEKIRTCLPQIARDYPFGSSTTHKITEITDISQFPEDWDETCIPYGIQTNKTIKKLLIE